MQSFFLYIITVIRGFVKWGSVCEEGIEGDEPKWRCHFGIPDRFCGEGNSDNQSRLACILESPRLAGRCGGFMAVDWGLVGRRESGCMCPITPGGCCKVAASLRLDPRFRRGCGRSYLSRPQVGSGRGDWAVLWTLVSDADYAAGGEDRTRRRA